MKRLKPKQKRLTLKQWKALREYAIYICICISKADKIGAVETRNQLTDLLHEILHFNPLLQKRYPNLKKCFDDANEKAFPDEAKCRALGI